MAGTAGHDGSPRRTHCVRRGARRCGAAPRCSCSPLRCSAGSATRSSRLDDGHLRQGLARARRGRPGAPTARRRRHHLHAAGRRPPDHAPDLLDRPRRDRRARSSAPRATRTRSPTRGRSGSTGRRRRACASASRTPATRWRARPPRRADVRDRAAGAADRRLQPGRPVAPARREAARARRRRREPRAPRPARAARRSPLRGVDGVGRRLHGELGLAGQHVRGRRRLQHRRRVARRPRHAADAARSRLQRHRDLGPRRRVRRVPVRPDAGTTDWVDALHRHVAPYTCSWDTTAIADDTYDVRATADRQRRLHADLDVAAARRRQLHAGRHARPTPAP